MGAEPRALRVAVTGSAGVGKTTLARTLAEQLRLPLVHEEMREHLVATGRRLAACPPPETAAVLETLWRRRVESERRLGSFVADNCSLDFAAYALHHGAQAPSSRSPSLLDEAAEGVARYDAILLLPWGSIPYERDGVRSDEPKLELRYQLLLEALLARHADPRRVHRLPERCTGRADRLAWALHCLETARPARHPEPPREGLLVVYTGDGKGKTTAALGMVFRALGRGVPVAVVQFIKGKWKTGERLFAATLPQLTFLAMGDGFTWEGDDPEVHARAAGAAWERARALLAAGAHRIVVLDELTHAVRHGFVPLADVLAVLAARPTGITAVVTGRDAPSKLVEAADLVTEMRSVKHPFDEGVRALPGIDF